MRNFKQFLKEQIHTEWQYKTKDEIEFYLKYYLSDMPRNYIEINEDLTITINYDTLLILDFNLIKYNNLNVLPIQYKKAKKVYITAPKLDSFKGLPYECDTIGITLDSKITSLEYLPVKINNFAQLQNLNKVKNAIGIGRKYLKQINQYLFLPDSIESNILGCCLIGNVNKIGFYNNKVEQNSNLKLVSDIINKHLHTDGEECAEELRQNGFNDYAKF